MNRRVTDRADYQLGGRRIKHLFCHLFHDVCVALQELPMVGEGEEEGESDSDRVLTKFC